MKKGIIGAVFGLLAFFVALNVIFISNGSYFTMGMSIFPIIMVVLFVFVVSKIVKASKEQNVHRYHDNGITRSVSKHCVKCKALISSSDKYCPECGSPQNDTIICEYCGHENPKTNALCENCNGFL